jgi:hypothetical protein
MKRLHLAKPAGGPPVAHLLQAHRQFSPAHALSENIGDGFLCEFNPVFRALREEARARGARFSDQPNAEYYTYPLMSLDEAMEARVIPYRPNASWLAKLAPLGFTLGDLKNGELQFNYVFHESAHFVAHSALFGRRSVSRAPKTADTLLAIMVGEAFANMVECLASAFVEGEIGSFFLDANCHFRANEREVKVLRTSLSRFGAPATARALLAAFLYSNYLRERLSAGELVRVARFAEIPVSPALKRLVKIGLELNEEFRTVTTPLHLRKCGFAPKQLPPLFAADPLKRLLEPQRLRLRHCAGELALIAAREAHSEGF